MTRSINYSLLLIMAIIFMACQYPDVNKTFNFNDKWEISYPSYLTKTTYVYPGAEFQARNGYRDTNIFLRQFDSKLEPGVALDSLSALLEANLVDSKIDLDTTFSIDSLSFNAHYITGLLQDKKMFYLVSVIQSPSTKYHFGGWMFDTKRALWQEDYESTLKSFRELEKKKPA